jgi:hypothetical protein
LGGEGRTWLKEDGKKGLTTELRWEKIWSNSAEMGIDKGKENLIYCMGGIRKLKLGWGGGGNAELMEQRWEEKVENR